jgi:hypothetical protein
MVRLLGGVDMSASEHWGARTLEWWTDQTHPSASTERARQFALAWRPLASATHFGRSVPSSWQPGPPIGAEVYAQGHIWVVRVCVFSGSRSRNRPRRMYVFFFFFFFVFFSFYFKFFNLNSNFVMNFTLRLNAQIKIPEWRSIFIILYIFFLVIKEFIDLYVYIYIHMHVLHRKKNFYKHQIL